MLLAIDSSTSSSGLALYDGLVVRYECIWTSTEFHSVDLAPGIQQALKLVDLQIKDLKAVAVAIGPGSYTGLRIGLAMAKGLAFSHNLAFIPVPTLDILAAGQPIQDLPMAAVLQAGRGRLYRRVGGGGETSFSFSRATSLSVIIVYPEAGTARNCHRSRSPS